MSLHQTQPFIANLDDFFADLGDAVAVNTFDTEDPFEVATRSYIAAGLDLTPLLPKSKAAFLDQWSTRATLDVPGYLASRKPGGNIGLRCGRELPGGGFLHVVDFDCDEATPEALAVLHDLVPADALRRCPTTRSGNASGARRHYWICLARPMAKTVRVVETGGKIELLGLGQQAVLPPSIHPDSGRPYIWLENEPDWALVALIGEIDPPRIDIAAAEAWGVRAKSEAEGLASSRLGLTIDEARELVFGLPAACLEERDAWRNTGFALHHEFAGTEGEGAAREVWREWSAQWSGWDEGGRRKTRDGKRELLARLISSQWRSFSQAPRTKRPVTMGWIKAESGASVIAGGDDWLSELDDLDELPDLPATGKSLAALPEERSLHLTKSGDPKATLHNATTILRTKLERDGRRVRWNLLAKAAELTDTAGAVHRIDEGLTAQIRIELERAKMHTIGKELTRDALRTVARENAYNPIQEHLEFLPPHDGTPRLGSWLVDYLNAEDLPYIRAVGRNWLVALVARGMLPGCKADNMLVLAGKQGLGKSQVFKILAGQPEWFSDALPNISKDGGDPAMKALRGKWLVEVGEMVATRKSEQEDLKAFLARQVDEYRLAFDPDQTMAPRTALFAGTTNKEEDEGFLRDASGDRRYWPAKVNGPLKLDELQSDREQLLAEALVAFRRGDAWHLSPEEETLAAAVQADWAEHDVWEEALTRAFSTGSLATGNSFTMTEVLRSGLEVPIERQDARHARRAGAILRKLGWRRKAVRTRRDCGQTLGAWRGDFVTPRFCRLRVTGLPGVRQPFFLSCSRIDDGLY